MHKLACKKVKVKNPARDVWTVGGAKMPLRYAEALEHNQMIASCCRHPENHQMDAWFSTPEQAQKGVPDIYRFHCTCGRVHSRYCVGGNPYTKEGELDYAALEKLEREEEKRPFWDVR